MTLYLRTVPYPLQTLFIYGEVSVANTTYLRQGVIASIVVGYKPAKCLEERREEREEKRAVNLQPAWTQEPRNSVRETSGPCINCKELTII